MMMQKRVHNFIHSLSCISSTDTSLLNRPGQNNLMIIKYVHIKSYSADSAGVTQQNDIPA
uniref:Uncharacterized protein n=1 Tax=Anguilla anguilla TaxID=7936 RepID=A0A0E9RBK7_ANGAN